MIETLSSNRQSSEYAKISAALAFIYERINNANATSDEQRSTHLVKSLELSSRLSAKIKNLKRRSSTLQAGALDLSMIDVPGSDSDSDNSDRSGTNAAEGSPTPTAASYTPKPVPVASWGIKFSGTSGDMSVDAFLERVAELKVSRNSSDRLVFDSAKKLAEALREEFQIPDHDDRLFEEIKRRTQDQNESMGLYVSIMKNLFCRLSVTLTEETQLKILLINILPFYQTQLGFTEVKTFSELLKYGKLLETRKAHVDA
ncbi:hypothetical protein QE152_g33237 [Popillia japonica]|uniref:Uncharacterized protein n=1 Tax=Popillia japonica TaxID=7064 RepID=A0AAW1IXH9_POPJA